MKRVLIIGPDFHYFNASIERAFQSLGWATRVDAYDTPVHPYTLLNKLRYKLGDKVQLKEQSRLRYDRHIRKIKDEWNPDFVFILNGDNLLAETVAYLHTNSKVIFWLFDSITRMMYAIDNLREADAVYCYEQEDIPLLAAHQITASFLPQAVDPTLYFPIEGIEKKYDIVFAGEIWNSPKRQRLLEAVIAHFPDKRIRIVGRYKIPTKGLLAWLFRRHRDIYTNKNALAEELNRLYNESYVVLNIHNEQQQDGANPKVYEILASGARQVCDSNPYLQEQFADQMDLYTTEQEMLAMISIALTESSSSKKNEVFSGNTFVDRIKTVLSEL